jgi:hypothetical protein
MLKSLINSSNESNMKSFKAIFSGFLTIILLGLCNQLLVIMAAVWFNHLGKTYPLIVAYEQALLNTLLIIGLFFVMAAGGYVTAAIAPRRIYFHSMIAALSGSSLSLYLSLRQDILTPMALLYLFVGIAFCLAGSWIWKRINLSIRTEYSAESITYEQ